jgi:hypothetical protein
VRITRSSGRLRQGRSYAQSRNVKSGKNINDRKGRFMTKTLRQGAKRLCIGSIALFGFVTLELAALAVALTSLAFNIMLVTIFLPVRVVRFVLMRTTVTCNAQDAIVTYLETCGNTALDWLRKSAWQLSKFLKARNW